MIDKPTNSKLACFTISVLRKNGIWTKECHPHAPGVTYKFFTYNDADRWVRAHLDDYYYTIDHEILIFDPQYNNWF